MLFFLANIGCANDQSADNTSIIAEAAIEIERTVIMPEGADALENYTRYYAISSRQVYSFPGELEEKIVVGIFLISDWAPEREYTPIEGLSGAYFVENEQHLPIVLDGGCGVVTVFFDIEEGLLVGFTESGIIETKLAACNGIS